MHLRWAFVPLALFAACHPPPASDLPPAPAGLRERLEASLTAARPFEKHVWRDVAHTNADGTLNGYVEISRGESTKFEFSIPLNRLEIDRMIPPELGGYPINYGFIPRTVSYDGDPADVLVLGPSLMNDALVKGRIVALMKMQDSGDLDSKIVITPLDERGAPKYQLEDADRDRMKRFFDVYKRHQGKPTEVTGWGSEAEARAFLDATSRFFSSVTAR